MVRGSVEKGHLFYKNKTKLQENTSVESRQLEEDLIREDLCDEDHISAFQDQNAHVSPNPYDRHMLVSVNPRSLPEHEVVVTDRIVAKPLSIGCKRQNERRKISR